jgi:hypothetical protein
MCRIHKRERESPRVLESEVEGQEEGIGNPQQEKYERRKRTA